MEKQRDRETKMDTISRDNHLFKSKLDQMHQEQEVKVRSETRLKQGRQLFHKISHILNCSIRILRRRKT